MSADLTSRFVVVEVIPTWPTYKVPCTDDMRQMVEDIQRIEPTEQQRFEATRSLFHERFDANWAAIARSMAVPAYMLGRR